MSRPDDTPDPSAAPSPNPVHVVLLFGIAQGLSMVAAQFLAERIGFASTKSHRDLVYGLLYLLVLAGLVFSLHSLRTGARNWFRAPSRPLLLGDIAIAVLLMVTFTLGVHRVLVVMPMVLADPTYYEFWRLADAFAPDTAFNLLIFAIVSLLVGPFHEEVLFRGILLNVFRAAGPLILAIAASSLLFGLVHGRNAVSAAFAGIVLAIVYLRYESLWPAVLVHSLANALLWPRFIVPLTQLKSRDQAQTLEGWFIEFLFAALFIPVALVFWRRFRPG